MKPTIPKLYKEYFIDKGDERTGLFRVLRDKFGIERGLYPGSFVHITPSLVIPDMVYVDTDKRCKQFFAATATREFIQKRKEYQTPTRYVFHEKDFREALNEEPESFDLLISLYAGFISQNCKQYLQKGGILVVNNSHGDNPLAYLDSDFELIGIIKRNKSRFILDNERLEIYFIPKSGKDFDKLYIEQTMRGPAYVKTAYAYVFRKNEQKMQSKP